MSLLLGINDSKFWVIDSWIKTYSITVHLKNKSNNVEWLFTTVYGPILSSLRNDFLNKIRSLALLGPSAWLICGDFNLIRSRFEKQGPTYNFVLSNRFNSLIASLDLVELPLLDRKFTWSRSPSSPSKALLDKILCSSDWITLYPAAIVHSLPRCYSDHNPLIPNASSIQTFHRSPIRFDKTWLSKEGFPELVISWWNSFPLELGSNIGTFWKFKLQFF